ncbi:MAG: HNH endonuclease [Candidatus Moranbacteria bacterium]|nr:HNH endonuclease [Candidatus Moranbacteria bacterium]
MKEIKLGTKNLFAQVDDEDYDFLMQWKWYACKHRYTYYARAIIYTERKETRIRMHRMIMGFPSLQIDHKDRNGLNNQKSNLRLCSHGQNQMNRKSSGRSRYLGVNFNKRIHKGKVYEYIRANIKVGEKILSLGNFPTEEDAAIAYNNAAQKYHREFAKLNIIENERQN